MIDLLSDDDLRTLRNAHTGTDLETVCWEAAKEIIALRKHLEEASEIMRGYSDLLVQAKEYFIQLGPYMPKDMKENILGQFKGDYN